MIDIWPDNPGGYSDRHLLVLLQTRFPTDITAFLVTAGHQRAEKIASRKAIVRLATLLELHRKHYLLKGKEPVQQGVYDITSKVKQMITRKYQGNSTEAEEVMRIRLWRRPEDRMLSRKRKTEVSRSPLGQPPWNITDKKKLHPLLRNREAETSG